MPLPANALMQRVRDSVAGTYDLLGELGTDESGLPLYLAREIDGGALVGVYLKQDNAEGTEFTVEVRRTLGETVAVQGSTCPECGTALPDLERFCFQCGADLSGVLAAEGTAEAQRLLAALAAATAGRYEILGRMDREGSAGTVYLAREIGAERITALRLRRAEPGDAVQAEYVVRQTGVFRAPQVPSGKYPPVGGGAASAAGAIAGSTVPRAAASGAAPVYPPTTPPSPAYAPAWPVATDPASTHGASGGYPPVPPPSGGYAPVGGAGTDAPGDPAPVRRSPLVSVPFLAGMGLVLVAAVGYLAFSGDDAAPSDAPPAPPVATTPAPAPAVAAPVPTADSAAVADSVFAANAAAAAAATPPSAADSGTIRITATLPQGARVTVNGRTVRGRSIRLAPGSHVLAVSAAGFEPFTQRLRVAAGANIPWAPKLVAVVASNTPVPPPVTETPARTTPTCRATVRQEDWNTAMGLCATEANAGDAAAAASLARMHARGLGTRADATQAYVWYAKAAAGGDRDAQTALGYILRDGNGARKDAAGSVRWFKAAAEAGDRSAQLEYAVALEKGDGVAKDERSARDWYRKSADQGVFMAARRLARMIERGAGGPRNDAEAAAAFERAATLGDAESALQIAKWYRDGKGVAKNPAQALTWFRKAAELGNREAAAEVKRLEKG